MNTIQITCEEHTVPVLDPEPIYLARFTFDGSDYHTSWQPTAQMAKDRAMCDLIRRTSRIGV